MLNVSISSIERRHAYAVICEYRVRTWLYVRRAFSFSLHICVRLVLRAVPLTRFFPLIMCVCACVCTCRRYKSLGDLPNLALAASSPSPTPSPFSRGNGGFVFDYQLIDVPDYHGKGESTPLPHFYQVCEHVRSCFVMDYNAQTLGPFLRIL